ncbi:MFS transporter [Legionella anisa]|uniref:MFS transporter n=1 Tax=Legionella anisa TaxID=28082 RepID=UPI00104165E4|nr:MFS transporter [Legionella anisa]
MKIKLFIIITFSIITFFSSDMFLPSIPKIAHYFSISESISKLSVVFFFVGQLVSALFWGTLSDRLGHQKAFNMGVYIFLFGTILCTISTSFSFFLIGRVIEGIGSIVAPVIGLAIIQSLYPKDKSTRVMSVLGGIIALAPMIAPSIGGFIESFWGWRSNFYCILILTLLIIICFHKIPLYENNIQRKDNKNALRVYAQIISNKIFTSWVCLFALLACGQWCFITMIPFLYRNKMGLNPQAIGGLMTLSALFFIIGTFTVNKLLKYISVDSLIKLGIRVSTVGSLVLLFLHLFNIYYPILISLGFGIYLFGASLLWGSTSSRALQCFKESLGSASAIRSLLMISFFVLGSCIGTLINDKDLLFVSILLMTCAISSATVNNRINKRTIIFNNIEDIRAA